VVEVLVRLARIAYQFLDLYTTGAIYIIEEDTEETDFLIIYLALLYIMLAVEQGALILIQIQIQAHK
jgi:hypothetical protein